jgi:hypothetical protein
MRASFADIAHAALYDHAVMANRITLRAVLGELARRLAKLAKTINTTVRRLETGIDDRRERLARYTTWSSEDIAEFADALQLQRTIDRAL